MGALFSSRRPKLPENHEQNENEQKPSFMTKLFGKKKIPEKEPETQLEEEPETQLEEPKESQLDGELETQLEVEEPHIQNGGSNVKYHFITNPKTGRRVSIFGITGKKIIRQYLEKIQK